MANCNSGFNTLPGCGIHHILLLSNSTCTPVFMLSSLSLTSPQSASTTSSKPTHSSTSLEDTIFLCIYSKSLSNPFFPNYSPATLFRDFIYQYTLLVQIFRLCALIMSSIYLIYPTILNIFCKKKKIIIDICHLNYSFLFVSKQSQMCLP